MKKQKSQVNAVEVTVKSKEQYSYDCCLDFVQEVGLIFTTSTKPALHAVKEKATATPLLYIVHYCSSPTPPPPQTIAGHSALLNIEETNEITFRAGVPRLISHPLNK